jgi:hypothetical protein
MRRNLAILAVIMLVPASVILSMGSVASANTVLSGSTNCTLTTGFVNFTNGLSNTPPNGNEKADVYGQLSCTTANVLPSITSLTGVYKGIIKFKKTSGPNKARACVNFTGASPVDTIIAGSKYTISWNTSSGPAASSTVNYTGPYSAVTSPTMNLNFAPATAAVTGSFAGTTAQLLYALPNGCPVAAGPNTTTSGSLVI